MKRNGITQALLVRQGVEFFLQLEPALVCLGDEPAERLESPGALRRPRRRMRGDVGFQRLQLLPVLRLLCFQALDAAGCCSGRRILPTMSPKILTV